MRALLLSSSLIFAAAVAGCSSDSGGGATGDAGTDGAPSDAPSDSSEGGGTYACPMTSPTQGTPCDILGLVCEYGGDAHGSCTDLYTCEASKGATLWFAHEKDPTCGTNPTDCPTSFAAADGTLCTKIAEACDFAEGRCGCELCSVEAGPPETHWRCKSWSDAPAGCATPRPLLGTPCTADGQICDYLQCCRGPDMGPREECKSGVWQSSVDVGCSCLTPSCG